jgi:hypothetical protein
MASAASLHQKRQHGNVNSLQAVLLLNRHHLSAQKAHIAESDGHRVI